MLTGQHIRCCLQALARHTVNVASFAFPGGILTEVPQELSSLTGLSNLSLAKNTIKDGWPCCR